MQATGRYRLSRYVVSVPLSDRHTILHSTLYRSTVVVANDLLSEVGYRSGSVDSAQLAEAELRPLIEQEVLVSEEVDERDRVRYLIASTRFDYSVMEVMLLTTRACDFRCTYCTEAGRYAGTHMDSSVARDAVAYVKRTCEARGTRHLIAGFYGGEPLLNSPTMVHVADALREALDLSRIRLTLFVISNGYGLTETMFDRLAAAGIQHFQITLDGPEEIHNARRRLEDGSGTWRRIVENVIHMMGDSRLKGLSIRVNVDAHNAPWIPQLLDDLETRGLLDDRKRVQVYVAPVVPSPEPLRDWNRYILWGEEKARVLAGLWQMMEERGIPVTAFPNVYPCGLTVEWGSLIDPSGDIYACAGFLGVPEYIKGHLPEGGVSPRHMRILLEEPRNPCLDCVWVPICGGGCRHVAAMLGHPHCDKAFYDAAYPAFLRIVTRQSVEGREDLRQLAACI